MLRLRPASLHYRARGSVLVPVNLVGFGLCEEIDALGLRWTLKDEFHITAANVPYLADRVGAPVDDVSWAVAEAVQGRRAGPVRVRDELRLAREGEERTLVLMVSVDGLTDLYAELSGWLGAPLAPPPAHITLYTRPDGAAIGIHDERELRDLTRPLSAGEVAEVTAAAGLAALLGGG